ncbi:MAG TPA: class I SAM-dependent methyltransferase [Mycobacteriales bacterium]|nr:class I SAM-dependent methyltransferase [Mycobacteriales bacterium]
MPVDWGVGRYESTADTLVAASEVAVAAADIRPGVRVLDIGCGTGNATLLAAKSGADVIGVDPSPRLLDVARDRARAAGLSIDLRQGSAAQIPVDDASVDIALSVFAVIFAPDPVAAVADIARVLTPSGRFVMTAWLPDGAFGEVTRMSGGIVRAALGLPDPPAPFAWFEQQAVRELFAPYGFTSTTTVHQLAFMASSPDEAYDMGVENPIAVTQREALARAGHGDDVVERIRTEGIEILRRHNDDPVACRVTSNYAVHVADRHSRRESWWARGDLNPHVR